MLRILRPRASLQVALKGRQFVTFRCLTLLLCTRLPAGGVRGAADEQLMSKSRMKAEPLYPLLSPGFEMSTPDVARVDDASWLVAVQEQVGGVEAEGTSGGRGG